MFSLFLTFQHVTLCWERAVRESGILKNTNDSLAVTMCLASVSSGKARSHFPFSTIPHQIQKPEEPSPCWTSGQRGSLRSGISCCTRSEQELESAVFD